MLYRRIELALTFVGMIRLGMIEGQVLIQEILRPYLGRSLSMQVIAKV